MLTASALRVADVVRVLKKYKSSTADVAKLFGKEKLKDQIAYMNKTRIGLAAGVPGRVKALLAAEAMKTNIIEQIIIEVSFFDKKKRNILKIGEICKDLVDILGDKDIRQRIVDGKTKLVLF